MFVPSLLETDRVCLACDDDGDLIVPLRFLAGVDACVQGARVRMRMFKGEWFWNQDVGIPYKEMKGVVTPDEAIIGAKFNRRKVDAIYRAAILRTPAIVEVKKLELDLDGRTRKLDVTWEARTQFGDTPVDNLVIATTGGLS